MNEKWEQQDERVLEERRKIQCRGFSLLVWGLLISLLVQQLMHAPFAQYAAEFWLLIGCGVYQMIANVRRGFNLWGDAAQGKGRLLLSCVISGAVAVLVLFLLSEGQKRAELAVFLVVYIPVFYGLRLLLAYLSRKRQEKLERALDEADDS